MSVGLGGRGREGVRTTLLVNPDLLEVTTSLARQTGEC